MTIAAWISGTRTWRRVRVVAMVGLALCVLTPQLFADGEPVNGFPSWEERVMLEWTNRARSDPAIEMASCGSNCGDAFCYAAMPPLSWRLELNRAARFHADEQSYQGYMGHDSRCTLVSNISSLYPDSCQGQASCACVGGVVACNPICTTWSQRVVLFGVSPTGEIIAGTSDPLTSFYMWLYEPYDPPVGWSCQFNIENGHRWLLLKSTSAVGFGSAGYSGGDFGPGAGPGKIPSGAHYPEQGTTIAFRANWYDTGGPQQSWLNLNGTCVPMALERGSTTNGAWYAQASSLPASCLRYVFEFVDSSGQTVTYPTTGSFGVPNGGVGCADWDSARPLSCIDTLFTDGFESGNTTAWDATQP